MVGIAQAKVLYIVNAPAGARWLLLGNNYILNLVLCIPPLSSNYHLAALPYTIN